MRVALIAAAVCLGVGVVTWNVVFDSRIESAEQRYLALQRGHAGAVTIPEVMDPAIHDAALVATEWAAALAGAALLATIGVARRARRRAAKRQHVALDNG